MPDRGCIGLNWLVCTSKACSFPILYYIQELASPRRSSLSPDRKILTMSKHHHIQKIKDLKNTPAYSCGLLNSQIMSDLFTAYYRYLIAHFFLLIFFGLPLICPIFPTLVNLVIKQLLLIVVNKCPGESLSTVSKL